MSKQYKIRVILFPITSNLIISKFSLYYPYFGIQIALFKTKGVSLNKLKSPHHKEFNAVNVFSLSLTKDATLHLTNDRFHLHLDISCQV